MPLALFPCQWCRAISLCLVLVNGVQTSGAVGERPTRGQRSEAPTSCACYNSSLGSAGAAASRFTGAGPYG